MAIELHLNVELQLAFDSLDLPLQDVATRDMRKVIGKPATDIELPHFFECDLPYTLLDASHAPQIGVVEQDNDAICRLLHVDLSVIGPIFDGRSGSPP